MAIEHAGPEGDGGQRVAISETLRLQEMQADIAEDHRQILAAIRAHRQQTFDLLDAVQATVLAAIHERADELHRLIASPAADVPPAT